MDGHTYRLPYAIYGTGPVHAVITAGMDGDEYASIAACYGLRTALVPFFQAVTVTLLPVVNMPGFATAVSGNPLDGKFPKHIYPGSPAGSASEQLIDTVRKRFFGQATAWIDLHGGALTEDLIPCVLAYASGNRQVDERTGAIIAAIANQDTVFVRSHGWDKIRRLGQDRISYVICESGCRGRVLKADVDRLTRWTQAALRHLAENPTPGRPVVYRQLSEYRVPPGVWWTPAVAAGDQVLRGDKLGQTVSADRKKVAVIKSGVSGKVLWITTVPSSGAGDAVLAVAGDSGWL